MARERDDFASINISDSNLQPSDSPATPADAPLILKPEIVVGNGYTLLACLGRGGFGEVWKAKSSGGHFVAIKFVVLNGAVGSMELRALETIKNLRHANLLALFDSWHAHGMLMLVMEMGDGTLHQRLTEEIARGNNGIPQDELLEYIREAAKGLDYLNSHNVQHRDVKPQNFLLVGGSVKIADFGLAKVLEHTITSHTGACTPLYAAPEFFSNQVSNHSDQYSLAVTYCELRGNRRPFSGTAAQLMMGHLMEPPDLTMVPEPERPPLARALGKEPDSRWPNCMAFVRALEAAVRGPAGAEAPPPMSLLTPTSTSIAAIDSAPRGSSPMSAVPSSRSNTPLYGVSSTSGTNRETSTIQPTERSPQGPSGLLAQDGGEPRRSSRVGFVAALLLLIPLVGVGAWQGWRTFGTSKQGDDGKQAAAGSDAEKPVASPKLTANPPPPVVPPPIAEKPDDQPSKLDQEIIAELAERQRIIYNGGDADRWLKTHATTRLAAWRASAERRLPEGMILLGNCLKDGFGAPKDDSAAVDWYRKATEQGSVVGQINLGWMYEHGRGVKKDLAEAVKWFRRAAEQGNAIAQYNLGYAYANGRGVAKDEAEAVRWYRKAAEQNYANAQDRLGSMYANGRGVSKNEAESAKWYKKALTHYRFEAGQGDASGQVHLGTMYLNGRGVEKDEIEAVKWFRKAADQGYAQGEADLGVMYANGHGVAKNETTAVYWYRKAAEQDNAQAQDRLGWMYANGRGVAKDDVEALKWFRKAADQDNAQAQNNLGFSYANGRGVAKDNAEALKWYRKAADQDNAQAQANLGFMYANGHGVPKAESTAVEWYRKALENYRSAAEQGDASAQSNLAHMYANGHGVEKDEVEAVRWYRKAAEQNYAAAQDHLGLMYTYGRGVAKDEAMAVQWYRKAAEQDYAQGQNNLGVMYASGRGVAKDEAMAVKWYRKAAEQDFAVAQNNLGLMYEKGRGVAKDEATAVQWYRKAAELGNADAKQNLARLGK